MNTRGHAGVSRIIIGLGATTIQIETEEASFRVLNKGELKVRTLRHITDRASPHVDQCAATPTYVRCIGH